MCLLNHAYEVLLTNIKIERQWWPKKASNMGRSGTQFVAMVTETVKLVLKSTFSRILLQSIEHF